IHHVPFFGSCHPVALRPGRLLFSWCARCDPSRVSPHAWPPPRGRLASSLVNVSPPRSPASGAAGIRTPDLRRARAALSRLSYGPPIPCLPQETGGRAWTRTRDLGLIRAAL